MGLSFNNLTKCFPQILHGKLCANPFIKSSTCFLSSFVGSIGYEAATECNKAQACRPISCLVSFNGLVASGGVNISPSFCVFIFLLLLLFKLLVLFSLSK